jgi:hypothetical protein
VNKTLAERLLTAENSVVETQGLLMQHFSRLSKGAAEKLHTLIRIQAFFPEWREELELRNTTLALLTAMDLDRSLNGRVSVSGHDLSIGRLREITLRSYLTTTWSLADSICAQICGILCTSDQLSNRDYKLQLASVFVKQKNPGKGLPNIIHDNIKTTAGWPICLSYSLRNFFTHDCGRISGFTLLAPHSTGRTFLLQEQAWSALCAHTEGFYKVTKNDFHDDGESWPDEKSPPLLAVLETMERHVDRALGVLLMTSTALLNTHTRNLLGLD